MKKILLSSLLMTFIGFNAFGQSQLISFEASEGYNLGDIDSQQNWEYWGGLDAATGNVVNTTATNGTNSLQLISNFYMTEGGVERPVTGYNKTEYSFDYKIEATDGSDYTMAVWDSDYTGVAAFRINYAAGNIRILDGVDGFSNTSINMSPNTWYNFKMIVDMTAKTVEYFVNNASVGTKTVDSTALGFSIIDFYYDDFDSGFTVDNIVVANASNLSTSESNLLNNSVSIGPNPATDFISVNTKGKILSVEIYDLSGKKVLGELSGRNQINISSLQSGAYLVNVKTDKDMITKKIIKK